MSIINPYTKYAGMMIRATPYNYPVPVPDNGNMPDVPSHLQDPQGPSLEWLKNLFFISVPAVFRIGVPANITVQAPGHTHAFDATISVKSYPDENISYSSGSVNLSPENKFRNSAILTVQAKQLSEGQSSFSYVYLEVMSKHFSKSEKIPIIHDNGSLFIHTDKPVYTPQESGRVSDASFRGE
ncbi:expressed sequence AI182371 [Cricetulus griseus]